MSAPPVSFTSEFDSLMEVQGIIKGTFQQQCGEMVKDILKYSADSHGDLVRLKEQINELAKSKQEIDSLIHATSEISGRDNLTAEEAVDKFEELFQESMEENEVDDEYQNVLYSLSSFINDENEGETQKGDSDDILVTKTTQSYIDPLTKRPMVDPVKSKICSHAYEKDSILTYLGNSKKRCPYSGCQYNLTKKDLVDHFVLKMKLCLTETSE